MVLSAMGNTGTGCTGNHNTETHRVAVHELEEIHLCWLNIEPKVVSLSEGQALFFEVQHWAYKG